jgi:hypothetical protein
VRLEEAYTARRGSILKVLVVGRKERVNSVSKWKDGETNIERSSTERESTFYRREELV